MLFDVRVIIHSFKYNLIDTEKLYKAPVLIRKPLNYVLSDFFIANSRTPYKLIKNKNQMFISG